MLIHGHNMRDGSVFGDLDNFRDLEFLKDNPVTTFNTLYENCLYVPFAVFDISATPGDQEYVDMRVFNFARRMRTFSTSPLRPRIAPSSISPWTSSAAITCSRW